MEVPRLAGTGNNLSDQDTWPWKMVEILRKKTGKKIDFINGAIGGYSSFESYGRLWSRIRFFTPDIIIVYHAWNELYYFDETKNIISWRTLPDGSWSFDETETGIGYYEPLRIDPFLLWSQALIRIRLRLSKSTNGEKGSSIAKPLASQFDKKGIEIWRTNLKLIQSAAEITGAKLFVAKQATLIVQDLPEVDRARCRYEYHGLTHEAHIKAFQAIYESIEQEIPVDSIIDITGISGVSEFFYDHVHPTAEGTTKIAEIMARDVLPTISSEYYDDVRSK